MNRADLTVHGFRSTFRDWAAEQTNYPREVAGMALSLAIGDKVEAAYRRGDLLVWRRPLPRSRPGERPPLQSGGGPSQPGGARTPLSPSRGAG
jgi:hypothetical protein